MNTTIRSLNVILEEFQLATDEVCRLAGVSESWLLEHIEQGLLAMRPEGPQETWRFDAAAMRRVQRMACLERDFDAVPELAALVVDLENEVAALRARLRRLGLDSGRTDMQGVQDP